MRIGVVPQFLQNCEPDVEANFESSVETLVHLGARIEECDLPGAIETKPSVVGYEFYEAYKEMFERGPEAFGERVRNMLLRASKVSADRYALGAEERGKVEEVAQKQMAEWDFVIGPTSPVVAEVLGNKEGPNRRSQNTIWFNLTRQPAIAIPNGQSREGMPTSLMIAGRKFDDAGVLTVAALYPANTDHHTRRPLV